MSKTKKSCSEHMKKLGSKGGKATAKKGSEYMSELGKKGQQALKKKLASQ